MLIRTQDKKSLVNIETAHVIEINQQINTFYIVAEFPTGKEDLAKYNTEEKALKCLDFIQDAYRNSYADDNYTLSLPEDFHLH